MTTRHDFDDLLRIAAGYPPRNAPEEALEGTQEPTGPPPTPEPTPDMNALLRAASGHPEETS